MEKKRLLFVGAKRWSFTDEKGEIKEGVTAHIIDLEQENDSDTVGLIPSKTTVPLGKFTYFKEGTGIYDATISLDLTSRQPRVRFLDFELVDKIDLNDLAMAKV